MDAFIYINVYHHSVSYLNDRKNLIRVISSILIIEYITFSNKLTNTNYNTDTCKFIARFL